MKITPTIIKDCFSIKPAMFGDERGYFKESFNLQKFKENTGLDVLFVQDNISKSHHGVLRGLHIQKGIHAQAKLVQVLQGKVLDVVVDARPESPSFKKIVTRLLTAENHEQLFVPKGCLHGFSVLSESCLFAYKVDAYYNQESESGVLYNDSDLKIDWLLKPEEIQVSGKDKKLLTFNNYIQSL